MKVKYDVTVVATLQEVFEVIATEIKITDIDEWVAEKVSKSRIHNKNIYSYDIRGKETNKTSHKDKELELGRLWVFSLSKDKQGKEGWVFRTFVTFGSAKEYYIEQKNKGLEHIWLFLNEEIVVEKDLGFDIYELEYQPKVIDGLRTKKEVEDKLVKHYSNNEDLIIGDRKIEFTMKVSKLGKELPYIYNNEANCIEWL